MGMHDGLCRELELRHVQIELRSVTSAGLYHLPSYTIDLRDG